MSDLLGSPVPDKFVVTGTDGTVDKDATMEKMARAYAELERDRGSNEPPSKPGRKRKILDTATLQSYYREYEIYGSLGESTLKEIEDEYRVSGDVINQQMQAFSLARQHFHSQVKEAVGGEESFTALAEWARKNLSQGELRGFNAQVEGSADLDMAVSAAKNLHARYIVETGQVGTTKMTQVEGDRNARSGSGGAQPFSNAEEMTEAMNATTESGAIKMNVDSDYNDQINQRLAVTDNLWQPGQLTMKGLGTRA